MPAHLPAGTTPDIGIRSSQSRCREESNRAISLCVMSFLGGNTYTGLCASLISNVIPSCNKETIDMKPTNYPKSRHACVLPVRPTNKIRT